jgi:hypothetical protein
LSYFLALEFNSFSLGLKERERAKAIAFARVKKKIKICRENNQENKQRTDASKKDELSYY